MLSATNLESLINPNDIFIDCGANVGQETIPMAEKGAIVYSFEPNPYAFAELSEKAKKFPNVHVFQKAVWDRNTTMKLFLHEHSDEDEIKWSTGSSMVAEKANVLKDKYVEIEVVDLIEFVKTLNKHIRVLKIDVEGSEFEIIEKLINTGVYKLVDFIFVETHEKKIPSLKPKYDAILSMIKENNINNINLNWI